MGIKMRTVDTDSIEVFIKEIPKMADDVGEKYLKKSVKVLKNHVVAKLNEHRSDKNGENYTHMADDVQAGVTKDKYGNRVARVRGGRLTGAKWHLVNDGTYHSQPTHFMDWAIVRAEPEIEKILDEEMAKGGF